MITASYHDDDDLLRYFYFRFSGVLVREDSPEKTRKLAVASKLCNACYLTSPYSTWYFGIIP